MLTLSKKQLVGLIGSLVLFLGVFMPIVSVPMVGNMNYFQNGEGDGIVILVLAIISVVFIFLKKYKVLWGTSLISLGLLLFTLINIHVNISNAKAKMESELAGNPFRGLADMAMQSFQIQWGWAVLIIGCALLIACIFIKEQQNETTPSESNNNS